MNTEIFDTFIFDLDGTLLDSLPDLVVVTNAAFAELGFPPQEGDRLASFAGWGAKYLLGNVIDEDLSEDELEKVVEVWLRYREELDDLLTCPFAGIEEALATLREKGCKLGVFSNRTIDDTRSHVEKHFPDAFDLVHGTGPETPRKPEPDGILQTIEGLASTPERTVYVGDNASDMKAARAAGCSALLVDWGYAADFEDAKAIADAVVEQPADLTSLAGKPSV